MTIAFTKSILPYGWMGNMAGGYPITYNGKEYRTTEHLFQVMRFDDPAIQEEIRAAKNGFSAKIVAKKYPEKMLVQPCSEQDFENMRLCIRLKIEQHPDLKRQLLETDNELIVEDVTKRGGGGRNHVWGASLINGNWVGENVLGRMWMELRAELLTTPICDACKQPLKLVGPNEYEPMVVLMRPRPTRFWHPACCPPEIAANAVNLDFSEQKPPPTA